MHYLLYVQRRGFLSRSKKDKDKDLSSSTTKVKSIKEGYLMKKNARRRWKRRWIVLSDTYLYFYKNGKENQEPKKTIPLLTCSVKMYIKYKEDANGPRYGFQIFSNEENASFYGESQEEIVEWVQAIKQASEMLMAGSLGNSQTQKTAETADTTVFSSEKKEVMSLLELPENQCCADCGAKGKLKCYHKIFTNNRA